MFHREDDLYRQADAAFGLGADGVILVPWQLALGPDDVHEIGERLAPSSADPSAVAIEWTGCSLMPRWRSKSGSSSTDATRRAGNGRGASTTARLVDIAAEADELGADCIWLTEHHGFDDGYLPSRSCSPPRSPPAPGEPGSAPRSRSRRSVIRVTSPKRRRSSISSPADGSSWGSARATSRASSSAFGVDMATRFTDLDETYRSCVSCSTSRGSPLHRCNRTCPSGSATSSEIGARKAGRLGAPLLSIRRSSVAAYLEGLARGRSRRVEALTSPVTSTSSSPTIRKPPTSGSLLITCTNSTPTTRARVGRCSSSTTWETVAAKVESASPCTSPCSPSTKPSPMCGPASTAFPVDHVYTWSTVAEMPDDLAARHRELWLGPVRDAHVDDHPS